MESIISFPIATQIPWTHHFPLMFGQFAEFFSTNFHSCTAAKLAVTQLFTAFL